MMNDKIKLDKHTAPSGYMYHKDGRYVSTVYLAPNMSIKDYELVTVEEYEKIRAEEDTEEDTNEA